ncbi:hypothetical protein ACFLQL_00490 [Verrucomicrobiota bacterium]
MTTKRIYNHVPLCYKCTYVKTEPGPRLKSAPSVKCTSVVGCTEMADSQFKKMQRAPLEEQHKYCPILLKEPMTKKDKQDKQETQEFIDRINDLKERIALDRDELRGLLSELEDICDGCDEATYHLEDAADALSEYL